MTLRKTSCPYVGNPSTDAVLLTLLPFALWLGLPVRMLHLGMVTIITIITIIINVIMIIMEQRWRNAQNVQIYICANFRRFTLVLGDLQVLQAFEHVFWS